MPRVNVAAVIIEDVPEKQKVLGLPKYGPLIPSDPHGGVVHRQALDDLRAHLIRREGKALNKL